MHKRSYLLQNIALINQQLKNKQHRSEIEDDIQRLYFIVVYSSQDIHICYRKIRLLFIGFFILRC